MATIIPRISVTLSREQQSHSGGSHINTLTVQEHLKHRTVVVATHTSTFTILNYLRNIEVASDLNMVKFRFTIVDVEHSVRQRISTASKMITYLKIKTPEKEQNLFIGCAQSKLEKLPPIRQESHSCMPSLKKPSVMNWQHKICSPFPSPCNSPDVPARERRKSFCGITAARV